MKVRFHDRIADIGEATWNRLAPQAYPFGRFAFLNGLEATGVVGPHTAWKSTHAEVQDEQGKTVALLPLYEKSDSWGEFVFDFAWANAYAAHGLSYYPKLLNAIPFTPANGPRVFLDPGTNPTAVFALVDDAIRDRAQRLGYSSVHSLFLDTETRDHWRHNGYLIRTGCQFHWLNQDYRDFDDFLSGMRSKRRKNTRRERRRVDQAGIQFRVQTGDQLNDRDWQTLYRIYRGTFARKSGTIPFPSTFFDHLRQTMPDSLLGVLAERGGEVIAAAINFIGEDTLYGRYWGCMEEIDCLHFETCYYQGIDYCIAHGFKRFEPGAQGEFKILRGFVPHLTWSAHKLMRPEFSDAIGAWLEHEHKQVRAYRDAAVELLPYRKDRVPQPSGPTTDGETSV